MSTSTPITTNASDAYRNEISLALMALNKGVHEQCFHHLERAHILGQRSTSKHVYAHWLMLRVGVSQGDSREVVGQMIRIAASLLFSRVWVPQGNTGRARVNAMKPMAVPEDLRHLVT
jgi:hypothetical protein